MERFSQLRREHPDFPIESLPAIPAEWAETSWRNDACPSFAALGEGDGVGDEIRVWIDYEDPAQRERGKDVSRFAAIFEAEDFQTDADLAVIYEGDDFDALLAAVEAFKTERAAN